ncbi:MAG: OmpA family protein, partial [Cyclobacteriaceae bacterium]|nr:OmpA family protein [Cyclobacteriaceae bacterium]
MRLYLICLFVILLFSGQIFSQNKKPEKSRRVLTLAVTDTIEQVPGLDIYSFPNVNKVMYYRDEKKAKAIMATYNAEDWDALYPMLIDYISNFGIMNFYKDTKLIWRLAKITEMYGNYDEALALYKLVLRHHRADIDIRTVELHYDSLNTNKTDYYVPLEFYYELVDYRKEVDTLQPPRSVLLNMGPTVNSDWSDYGPYLGSQNNLLIFTSKRNGHISGAGIENDEDLFVARKNNQVWENAFDLDDINTIYNEGSGCLSKDGKTLIFARCNSPETYGDCDLFSAKLDIDSAWRQVRNIGPEVNSKSWDSHPSLSPSGDTLYFSSDRIGGFGLADIYYSVKDIEGNWTAAKNMGAIINTRNSEVSPFYHQEFDV